MDAVGLAAPAPTPFGEGTASRVPSLRLKTSVLGTALLRLLRVAGVAPPGARVVLT